MAKVTVTEAPSVNIIGPMTKLEGNLKCNGDIRIEGSIKGSIDCSGKLVIGNTGEVDGDISCRNGDFSGKIKGQVNVNELLVLKSTVIMEGDMNTGKLAIEPGARFSGKCTMDLTAETS